MTPADAQAAGLAQIGGAKVSGFIREDEQPGAEGRHRDRRLIVAADGKPVDQVSTLQRIIRGYKPGDVVDLDVMRFGQKKTFKVKLGEPPTDTHGREQRRAKAPRTCADGIDAAAQNDKLGIARRHAILARLRAGEPAAAAYRIGAARQRVSRQRPGVSHSFRTRSFSAMAPSQRDIHTAEDLQAAVGRSRGRRRSAQGVREPESEEGSCQTRVVSMQVQ